MTAACTQRLYWSDVKQREILSANIDGLDRRTLLRATHGLGFVEGNYL